MAATTFRNTSTADSRGELALLSREFPAWHIWISRGGRWWATRRGNAELNREHDDRWSMTVDADTSAELRESVRMQEIMR